MQESAGEKTSEGREIVRSLLAPRITNKQTLTQHHNNSILVNFNALSQGISGSAEGTEGAEGAEGAISSCNLCNYTTAINASLDPRPLGLIWQPNEPPVAFLFLYHSTLRPRSLCVHGFYASR